MKKYIPFIFPAIALIIVLFLGYRWYSAQTVKPEGKIDMSEGMKIDELSAEEMKKLQGSGSKDLPSVELQGEGESMGRVRYEIRGDKVSFSVTAELAALTEGKYQVWLKRTDSETPVKAFVLEEGKAGYIGSGSVDASLLPFEVIVSKEMNDDNQVETTVLRGTIQK
jgi:hypothetical protein